MGFMATTIGERLSLDHTSERKRPLEEYMTEFGFAHSPAAFDPPKVLYSVNENDRVATAQSLKDAIPCREGFLLVDCLSGFRDLRQSASFGELIHRNKGAGCVRLTI
jgi:hypothetical protein